MALFKDMGKVLVKLAWIHKTLRIAKAILRKICIDLLYILTFIFTTKLKLKDKPCQAMASF